MKILFPGNNDAGTVMLMAAVMLLLIFLLLLPCMNSVLINLSYEKRKYESICEKIEMHNRRIEALYETN